MPTLAERSLRVALTGVVPDDDPTIIADMLAEIERLRDRLTQPSAGDMRAFSASEAVCYKWPEDTTEHKALRAAYLEGAADCGDLATLQRQLAVAVKALKVCQLKSSRAGPRHEITALNEIEAIARTAIASIKGAT